LHARPFGQVLEVVDCRWLVLNTHLVELTLHHFLVHHLHVLLL
jgi:hypothetical protein